MAEEGKTFVPPTLTKKPQDYPRLNIGCSVCNTFVDGYVLSEGVLNVYCHGTGKRMVLADYPDTDIELYRGGNGAVLMLFDDPPRMPAEPPFYPIEH